jgi:hypothetical protein
MGHLGFRVDQADGRNVVSSVLGYYMHAVCKEEPTVTDDAESTLLSSLSSPFTANVVSLRKSNPELYLAKQEANLSNIVDHQMGVTANDDSQ